jgi:hypothetical protein
MWGHKQIHFHRNLTLEMQMFGSDKHPAEVRSEHANVSFTRATKTHPLFHEVRLQKHS